MGATIDTGAAVRRLLVRTGFGASADQVTAATKAGFTDTLDRVLGHTGTDKGAAATPAPSFKELTKPGRSDTDARKAYTKARAAQRQELAIWWLDRMVAVQSPWLERRTLLWHGHWATSIKKVKSAGAMIAQNETERRLGGGDFRTFARAMVVDPALMIWLDAGGNTAKAPNENLSRELMELFTLGHGNYSETDVRQAARALTGWRVDRRAAKPTAQFAKRKHADGTEKILGKTADFTAQSLVDLLVSQPASARYLATRIWGWLVSPTAPSAQAVDRITAAYGSTRDVTAMFRALLTDPAFLAADSVLVKQPIEYVVGAMRALKLRPSTLDKKGQRALLAGLLGLGQVPFLPPSVGGWPVGGAWLTTAAAQARITLAARLSRIADISTVEHAAAKDRPDAAAALLGLGDWTDRTRGVLADAADNPAEVVTLALAAPEYTVSG